MRKRKLWNKGSTIDKTVLKDCKKRHTNLSMAWIGYRKAYDLDPHSWVNECMEMFGIAENFRTFLDISERQSIIIVVCVEYGTIVFDS